MTVPEATRVVTMKHVEIDIASTGNKVVLEFPLDMTDAELIEFVGWLGNDLRLFLQARRLEESRRRLVLPEALGAH